MDKGRFSPDMIQALEDSIKEGRIRDAQKMVSSLDANGIPRGFLLPMATICRRIQFYDLGLRFLEPIIHRQITGEPANSEEIIEYALGLQNLGLIGEASSRIKALDQNELPQAMFLGVHLLIKNWDYANAVDLLREYIIHPKINEYEVAIGQTNLLAALVTTEQMLEAEKLSIDLINKCQQKRWNRLLINNLELKSRIHVYKHEFRKAEELLQHAGSLILSDSVIDKFFLQKQRVILEAFEMNKPELFDDLQITAESKGYWGSVRDIEYRRYLLTKDPVILNRLFFGTPYAGFRKLLTRYDGDLNPSFHINGVQERSLRLLTAIEGGHEVLKPGKKLHKLLTVLLSDFYQPMSVGYLFGQIFSGEEYLADSSSNRVHQLISRLRATLKKEKTPIQIVEKEGHYSAEIGEGYCVIKERELATGGLENLEFQALVETFKDGTFSNKDARETLKLSRTQTVNIINAAIEKGILEKIGKGGHTKYYVKRAI